MLNVEFAALAAAAEPVGHVPHSGPVVSLGWWQVWHLWRVWVRISAAAAVVLRGLVELDRV